MKCLSRLLRFALVLGLAAPAFAQTQYQRPPDALAQLIEAPATPGVSLSPDRQRVLMMDRADLPTIADLSAPELRLAGMRINPANNAYSRSSYFTGLTLKALDGTERTVTGLPSDARIADVNWSPDGAKVAFLVLGATHVELWGLDVASARARRLMDTPVNALFTGYTWHPDGQHVIAQAIPENRGPAPGGAGVPTGPVVQSNSGAEAPARTYQDLLEDASDERLFDYYTTSQLVRVGWDGTVTKLGAPGLFTGFSPSPDGQYLLVQRRHRPFSYIVPWYRFPNEIAVWNRQGQPVHTVADLGLMEEVPVVRGSTTPGARSVQWRDDAPATLVWAEALDNGDPRVDAASRDVVLMQAAPFNREPEPLAALESRFSGIDWSDNGYALLSEYWSPDRRRLVHLVRPDEPGMTGRMLFDYTSEDRYNDPGQPMTAPTENGGRVLLTEADGRYLFLSGTGASPEGNRPFVRRYDLETGETEELFRSQAPYYESPVAFTDLAARHLLTQRESVTAPPNYVLHDLRAGTHSAMTDFPHPYPELAGVQKELITYTRADGVPLSATLYLPPGYDAERDGPLPTFLWAYPREFKSAAAAGQMSGSPYRFTRISYWGAVPYVLQGYAILDNAAFPIIGEGDAEPNDTFVEQLVMNGQAAIDEGVRRGVVDPNRVGVGGHSYGAFMTANLLAHSDLFKAGVARSGAYNRSLTPFGFQNEARTFWEAPEIYFEMSPFMNADKIDEPLLMIHGIADNNSGTFPMQSERLYGALKGMGRTVRLVMLPHESHGYRAKESLLHMLYETDRWLNLHVKSATGAASSDG